MLNPRTGCNWLQPVFLCVGCGQSGCKRSQSGLSGNLSEGQPVAVPVESKKGKRPDWTGLSNTSLDFTASWTMQEKQMTDDDPEDDPLHTFLESDLQDGLDLILQSISKDED